MDSLIKPNTEEDEFIESNDKVSTQHVFKNLIKK